jgi:hypothetical protein
MNSEADVGAVGMACQTQDSVVKLGKSLGDHQTLT